MSLRISENLKAGQFIQIFFNYFCLILNRFLISTSLLEATISAKYLTSCGSATFIYFYLRETFWILMNFSALSDNNIEDFTSIRKQNT